MRSVGLITEYNPFHNGHLYHLQESRRLAGAEVAVAVMSGHFLQRGEPALVDKWRRTRMALAAGVDVVVELPFPWACNSAPQFAAGAVAVLEALGGIEALCFGSECGDLASLQRCSRLLRDEAGRIAVATAELLKEGLTYPAAREQVVRSLPGREGEGDLLGEPNNILGLAYLQALEAAGSAIEPLTLQRIGAGFHDREATGGIASATGIRRMLADGDKVEGYLPKACREILDEAIGAGETVDPELLQRLLVAVLVRDIELLPTIYQVEQGLENRLVDAAVTSGSHDQLVAAAKARQLTRTRIQRVLTYVLLGVRRDLMQQALAAGPRYLSLLGCSERGQRFLAATRKRRTLPLVQNFSRIHATLKRRYGADTPAHREALVQLQFQERATAVYRLLLRRRPAGDLRHDYHAEPVTDR